MRKGIDTIFYWLKPVVPRPLQLWLRRKWVLRKREEYHEVWPILESAAQPPPGWMGWPNGKAFAVVLTHDVEWGHGQEKSLQLMRAEQELGFRSSFNFVPERYRVSSDVRRELTANGFEVGVHGLNHDGKLYQSHGRFLKRALKINEYLRAWDAVGFRSPAMHRNLAWIHALNIAYDASTFDTDPFEPQPDGVGTIFPFLVRDAEAYYVELPYTLAQDFTLFVLMGERDIGIWRRKLDWIAAHGGMALLNTHPDYMNFDSDKTLGREEYPARYYTDFLQYLKQEYDGRYWHALAKDVARYARNGTPTTGGSMEEIDG